MSYFVLIRQGAKVTITTNNFEERYSITVPAILITLRVMSIHTMTAMPGGLLRTANSLALCAQSP